MQWKRWKQSVTFTNVVLVIGLFGLVAYAFSFLFPITNDAFVVGNVRPVAAQVDGFVTDVYVKNGQTVSQGQRLFSVAKPPYLYQSHQKASQLKQAESELKRLQSELQKDQSTAESLKFQWQKNQYNAVQFQKGQHQGVTSSQKAQDAFQDAQTTWAEYQAAIHHIAMTQQAIHAQKHQIEALKADYQKALYDLQQTTVYADNDGVVQNCFLSAGTPVIKNKPLFAIVPKRPVLIQANFRETDLRLIQAGDNVLIFPRMYLFTKVFHGRVVSNYWSANRQMTSPNNQLQQVSSEHQWLQPPQRLPVQIKVTDPDDDYPLPIGASAYVYIQP